MATSGPAVHVEVVRSEPGARERFDVGRADVRVILDVLVEVGRLDPSLSFRYSCRSGFCGTCTVLLDGRAVLACQAQVPDTGTVHLAPLGGFPVVRDLVVDPAPFAQRWEAVGARLAVDPAGSIPAGAAAVASDTGPREPGEASEPAGPRPLGPTGRDVIESSLDCISCGACFAACDLSALDRAFLGPAALTRAMVVIADPRDRHPAARSAAIAAEGGVEACHGIGACSLACPKDLDPARAIRRLRRWQMTGRA